MRSRLRRWQVATGALAVVGLAVGVVRFDSWLHTARVGAQAPAFAAKGPRDREGEAFGSLAHPWPPVVMALIDTKHTRAAGEIEQAMSLGPWAKRRSLQVRLVAVDRGKGAYARVARYSRKYASGLLEWGPSAATKYRVTAPAWAVISGRGVLLGYVHGMPSTRRLEADVQRLLSPRKVR